MKSILRKQNVDTLTAVSNMTREQKIEFLRGLENGTRKLDEFSPHEVEFFEVINGKFKNLTSGRVYSESEFQTRKRAPSGTVHTILFEDYSII